MGMSDCLIIIPAYNEEKSIGRVLREIRRANVVEDIVVINDGSLDGTRKVVEEAGESVINHQYNLGYGAALQTGFKYAVMMGYRYAIQFDGDGQHRPRDISVILEELRTGIPDVVIGSRFLGKGSLNTSFLKGAAIWVFRFLIRIFTGTRITDPTSGLQGLSSIAFSHYARMGNFPEDYPDADTLIFMILSGCRVKEIPVNMRERQSGKGMHSGLKILFYLIKMPVSILVVLIRKKTGVGGVFYGKPD